MSDESRLAVIRKHHADFPCSLYPEKDECFLLSQLDNAWAIIAELRGQLSVVKDEHEELVTTRATIKGLERQVARIGLERNEFKREKESLIQERDSLIESLVKVNVIISTALAENQEQ